MAEPTPICPHCKQTDRQVKAGMHEESQRYKCMHCGRRYLMNRKREIAPEDVREQAIALHRLGHDPNDIARRLGANPRNISNWLQKVAPISSSIIHDETRSTDTDSADVARSSEPAELRRRATVFEVADLAGVSVSTVSNYLTNKGRMSAQTRQRISDAVSTLRFTPNSLVRAIRTRKTNIIGVVPFGIDTMHESLGDNPTPALIAGIAAQSSLAENNILMYTRWFERRDKTDGLEFLNGHIDGLIWVSPRLREPQLETVVAAGLPAVTLLASRAPAGAGSAAIDNVGGVEMLVKHLAALGHTRIAYIGAANASDFVERMDGYRSGLEKNGIAFDPELLAAGGPLDWSWPFADTSPYATQINEWMHMSNRPTAIMANYDQWALWIYRYLVSLGLKVPGDVAVTGFDDTTAASMAPGGITTIKQNFYQIARLGTQMLYKLIGGAPASECQVIYPCELVVRGSTVPKKRGR